MISRCGRKITAIIGYSTSLICAIILFFVWNQGSTQSQSEFTSIFVLVLVFVFRFVVTVVYTYLFVYIVELFPTQVRVLGTGVFYTMGGISVTLCPLFIHFCMSHGVSIMAFLVVSCAINIYLSNLLPETLGKRTEEEV